MLNLDIEQPNPASEIDPVNVVVGGDYPVDGHRLLDAISDADTATFHGNHLGTKGTVQYFAKLTETPAQSIVTICVRTTAEMWTDGAPPELFRRFIATQDTVMEGQGLDISFARPYAGRIEVRHQGKVLLSVPLADLAKSDSKQLALKDFRHEFVGPLEGTNDGMHQWGQSSGGGGLQINPYVGHWFFHEGPAPKTKPFAYANIQQKVLEIEWFRK